MSETAILHWTDDDHLLTEYVMGRITDVQRRKLEAHVQTCARCREAVEREQAIVSGVRKFGREEMKARLKRRIAATPATTRTSITWRRVVSAAAAILIVFGVGVYNRWIPLYAPSSDLAKEEAKSPEKGISEENRIEPQLKEQEPSPTQQGDDHSNGRDEEAIVRSPSEKSRTKQPSVLVPESQFGKTEGSDRSQNAAVAPSAGGGLAEKKDLGSGQIMAQKARPDLVQIWIQGEFLEQKSADAFDRKQMMPTPAADQDAAKSKEVLEPGVRQTQFGGTRLENEIRVSQQAVGELPVARQQMQLDNRRGVQAKVRQTGRGMILTMFLDTLFDEGDIRAAKVLEVAPDSLVIQVRSQEIGFRLPRRVLELQKAEEQNRQR